MHKETSQENKTLEVTKQSLPQVLGKEELWHEQNKQ